MTSSRFIRPLVAIALAACAQDPVSVFGTPSDTLAIRVNQKLEVTLQNVGPGEYQSPPTIVSESDETVLRFLDAAHACPCPPAGVTQLFRFEGRRRGLATVTFTHSYFGHVKAIVVRVF